MIWMLPRGRAGLSLFSISWFFYFVNVAALVALYTNLAEKNIFFFIFDGGYFYNCLLLNFLSFYKLFYSTANVLDKITWRLQFRNTAFKSVTISASSRIDLPITDESLKLPVWVRTCRLKRSSGCFVTSSLTSSFCEVFIFSEASSYQWPNHP